MSKDRIRIYLVDDNDIDLAVNGKLIKLAALADEVVPISGARKFLDLVRTDPHLSETRNFLLLDIMMPGMNGFETLEEFAGYPDEIKDQFNIYLLSSSIDRNDIRRAEQTRLVKRVLEKPLDTFLLKTLIDEALRES